MKITLYSTHCPKCKIIETKLERKSIEFKLIDDTEKVIQFGKENNIMSAPILVVDTLVMDFKTANDWINRQ